MIGEYNLAHDRFAIAAINGHDALVPDYVSGSNDNAAAVGNHISSRSMTALQ
jgi:phosphate/sulfate permease